MLINIHTHHSVNPKQEILDSEQIIKDGYFSFGEMYGKTIHELRVTSFDKLWMTRDEQRRRIEKEKVLLQKNCIAIGEIGLDKTISVSLDKQIELFIKQINTSEKFKLPVIIHCVKSWNEILAIRKKIKPTQTWIFHGFRKTNLVESVLNSGVHISIGTAVLWDEKLQDCVQKIPTDRLFLETDNDTNYSIEDVYLKVALIKNISLSELEKQIELNTINTFRKWEIG